MNVTLGITTTGTYYFCYANNITAPGGTVRGNGIAGINSWIKNSGILLGNDADGWEGTGLNDIWEVRKLLNGEPRRFKKSGLYKFSINHIMRDNPLQHIMSIGLRVEKQQP
jgi:gliding motility-associated lipoprotein GldH